MNQDKLDALITLRTMPSDEWWFWGNVAITEDTTICWEWKAARQASGVGAIQLEGKVLAAHRVAFFFAYGRWPDTGFVVMHICDNPGCVNPFHLKEGTHQENMADMATKGRAGGGGGRKLSDQDILDIQMRYAEGNITQGELAEMYQVTMKTIWRVVNGQALKSDETRQRRVTQKVKNRS